LLLLESRAGQDELYRIFRTFRVAGASIA